MIDLYLLGPLDTSLGSPLHVDMWIVYQDIMSICGAPRRGKLYERYTICNMRETVWFLPPAK